MDGLAEKRRTGLFELTFGEFAALFSKRESEAKLLNSGFRIKAKQEAV